MHLKLTIAYDGAAFGGWQIQANADTIQERIEKAIATIAKEPVSYTHLTLPTIYSV